MTTFNEVNSLKDFLFHTTNLDYSEDECEFILKNKLIHSWI